MKLGCLASVAGALLLACSPGPARPPFDLTGVQAGVRHKIEQQREKVNAEPLQASGWIRLAMVLDAHGLLTEAEDCYRAALERAPEDFRTLYNLASVLELQRIAPAERLALLDQASGSNPSYAPLACRLGKAHGELGALEEAEAAYLRAIQLDPTLALAHRSLGLLLLDADQAGRALPYLERAALLAPRDGPTHAALAQALRRSGDKERALAVGTKARLPESVDLPDPVRAQVYQLASSASDHFARARVAFQEGNTPEAIRLLKRAAQSTPDDPQIQLWLGRVHMREDPAEAARYFERALELKEDSTAAHLYLGELLLGSRGGKAVGHFERAVELQPNNFTARALLGQAYLQQADLNPALEAFEAAWEGYRAAPSSDARFPALLEAGVRILEQTGPSEVARLWRDRLDSMERP